jgi:hypothetical protein
MKYIKLLFPFVIVLLSVVGIIASYGANNTAAFHANIMAALGWLIVASDAVVDFLNERKSNV